MIYFIRQGNTNFVKIGFSRLDSISRLSQLQTGNPQKLELIAEWEGAIREEQALHKHYIEYRKYGEWFELPLELIKQIKRKKIFFNEAIEGKVKRKLPPDWKQIKAIFG